MLLAFGGIISAFIIILLWLSSVLTFNTIAILSLASFLIGVVLIEGGVKNSLICYGAVGLISLVLPIDRINVMAFILFFGYYPILKSLIEKINKLSFEIIIKLITFKFSL